MRQLPPMCIPCASHVQLCYLFALFNLFNISSINVLSTGRQVVSFTSRVLLSSVFGSFSPLLFRQLFPNSLANNSDFIGWSVQSKHIHNCAVYTVLGKLSLEFSNCPTFQPCRTDYTGANHWREYHKGSTTLTHILLL